MLRERSIIFIDISSLFKFLRKSEILLRILVLENIYSRWRIVNSYIIAGEK